MFSKNVRQDKISVIVPVYNGEEYIGECLASLLSQTLLPDEIIIINDGSTDATLEKIAQAAATDIIRVITVENGGQGKARNLGLDMCGGDYVMFFDADDIIEPETVELAYNAVSKDKSDFAVFDWRYYYQNNGKYKHLNSGSFLNMEQLEGEECLELLRLFPIFSVNKLYSKNFLLKNSVKYGDWHIYEDIPFWVKACIKAKKVSLIHKPLYTVRVNSSSTTKTRHGTNLHYLGYLCALDESFTVMQGKDKTRYSHLNSYFVSKFISYYNNRTPANQKNEFLKAFVDLANKKMPISSDDKIGNIPYKTCKKLKIFERKRYTAMKVLCCITGRFGGAYRSVSARGKENSMV